MRWLWVSRSGNCDRIRPDSEMSRVSTAMPAAPAPVAGPAAAADTGSGAYLYLCERMSEAVRAHLGLRGYFLQLKVERCTDISSLQALLPELRAAVAKAKGESFASDWERTLEVPA